MKKMILPLLLLAASTFSLASCNKGCEKCKDCPSFFGISLDGEYCEEDFDTTEEYNQFIQDAEDSGCNCK